ncbi:hypothetical protein ACFQ51_54630 [Streptomyces kaempferi]
MGAEPLSGADVRRIHESLLQQLPEAFKEASVEEQALDIALQAQVDRNTTRIEQEAVSAASDTEVTAEEDQDSVRAWTDEERGPREAEPNETKGGLEQPSKGMQEFFNENTLPLLVRKRLKDEFSLKDEQVSGISDRVVLGAYRTLRMQTAFRRQDPVAKIGRIAARIVFLDPRLVGGAPRKSDAAPSALAAIPEDGGTSAVGKAPSSRGSRVVPVTPSLVPIGASLDEARPPWVDTALPPAPVASSVPQVQFSDGSQMPPYMAGNVDHWLRGLSPEVRERSFTFGHSRRELRGIDLALQTIIERLAANGATRPKYDGTRLLPQLNAALRRDPARLFADGARLVYKTARRRNLELRVELRPHGKWRQVEHAGNPVKVDSMRQFTSTSGQVATNAASWGLTPSLPLGVWSAVTNWWARFSVQVKFGKQMDYDLNKKTEIDDKTHTYDARPYLDDARYEFSLWDMAGNPVDVRGRPVRGAGQEAAKFGFSVHDGILVWLDRSLTSPLPLGEGAPPAELDMERIRPGFTVTEAYGPMGEIREWALEQLDGPGTSLAAAAARDFFSSANFHDMSPFLNSGEVVSPMLRGGRSGIDPLGFFSVRVKSGPAVLVSVAQDAAITHAVQSYVPNGRTFKTSRGVEVGVAAGPSFQVSDVTDSFGMRASAGANIALGSSSAHAIEFGATASKKIAVTAQGVETGLYWVTKEITVVAPHRSQGPIPEPAENASGHRTLRKPWPGWTQRPGTKTFRTWALERLSVAEARRVAQDGARVVPDAVAPLESGRQVPAAPAYLTESGPENLGMSRVEDITFADGASVRDLTALGGQQEETQTVTFLDHFRGALMQAINEKYPNLVALDGQLSPDDPRWRNSDHYETAVYNRMQVHKQLEKLRVASNLDVITTTGDVIALVRSLRFTSGEIYVRLSAKLTGRRYEGRKEGVWISHSKLAINGVSGQQDASHSVRGGIDASLQLRDASSGGMNGGPLETGTVFAGVKAGRNWGTASGYGVAAVREPKATGSGAVHRWSYGVVFTAEVGGYMQPRLRHVIPGASASAFVSGEQQVSLFDHADDLDPRAEVDASTPGVGQVFLSVPVEHMSSGSGAGTEEPPHVEEMTSTEARALVMGTLPPAQSVLEGYPYQVVSLTGSRALEESLRAVLREASGSSWKLTRLPAPMLSAALRRVELTSLNASFGATSGTREWACGASCPRA